MSIQTHPAMQAFKTYAPEGAESILQEAQRVTHGERQQSYGRPFDDYTRAAELANILLNSQLQAADVAMIMLCVKLSRESHNPKRDNRVDIAGYAWVLDRCREQQEHDYAQAMIAAEAASVPTGTREDFLDIPDFLRQREHLHESPKWGGGSPMTAAPMNAAAEAVEAKRKGPTMAERIAATEAALEVGDDQN